MEDWQTGIVAAIGSPTAVVLVRYVFRLIRRAVRWTVTKMNTIEAAITGLSERMDKLEPDVTRIKMELSPNGGTSISDKISLIQEQVLIVEARSRVTWAISGEASYECDEQGMNVYCSPALCELFGMSLEEMSGSGWTRAIATSAEREVAWDNWRHAVASGIPYEDVYRVKNQRTGEIRRVRTYTTVCKNPKKGGVSRYFGSVVPTSADESQLPPIVNKTKPKGTV